MKNSYRFFAGVIALAALVVGCVAEPDTTAEVDITTVRCTIPKIDVEEDFATGILDTLPVTRATFSGGNFLWSAGDKIGILPNTGAQIYFEVDNGAGTSTASFDGGDWAMKSTGTFYAYYPLYPDIFLSKDHVSVSYTGQTQSGNNNNLHTGDYWTLYTEGTTSEGNALNFSFNHLTSFFKTYVTVPAGTYTKITFSAPSEVFIRDGYFDLSAQTPTIVGTTMTDVLSLDLQNVTFADETELTGYLVLAPVDITGIPITVTVYKDGEPAYEYTLTKASPMVAAKTYAFRATALTQLAASATQANAMFAAGATAVTITEPLTEDATIVLPNTSEAVTLILPTTASTSTLTVSYPQNAASYPATVTITGPEGADLNIQTPNSTVTVNGVSYDHVTSRTAANTCIIPAGVTVTTLKVIQGGVQVYGTVSQIDLSEQEDDAIVSVSGSVASLLGEDDEENVPATGVTLNQSSINLNVGATETLTATVAPTGAYPKVTWTSSDETVAAVSSTGVVTAVAAGAATITAKTIYGGFTATCEVIIAVPASIDGHEYVDLGLSVLWSAENMSGIFAWAETTTKSRYWWDNYKYYYVAEDENDDDYLTKYCIIDSDGWVDNKRYLETSDDAAYVNWGEHWRMPTEGHFQTLINSCTWTWMSNGYKVTGPNGNSIFIPTGEYWSNELAAQWSDDYNLSLSARTMAVNSSGVTIQFDQRWYGHSIRPICTGTTTVTSISLDMTTLDITIGHTEHIVATVRPSNVINQPITWMSTNPSVATVSQEGVVTACSVGIATITAECGGKSASCEVTVSEPEEEGNFVDPLTFTSSGATNISLTKVGAPSTITLYYKVDNGAWTSYAIGKNISLTDGESVSFRAGQTGNASFSQTYTAYYIFTTSGNGTIAASGNILSLINREGTSAIPSFCFYKLFQGCSNLTTPPELPATTFGRECYAHMFSGCTSLVAAPELPATSLSILCYNNMFYGCTSLVSAPILPAITLVSGCYENMFQGCSSLVTAPTLPATTLTSSCYESMFRGCTSLATAPSLPATTLAPSCYARMFEGCTRLTTAPTLPSTTLASRCYNCMFYGCTALTTAPALPATTLADYCYGMMFQNCSSLSAAPELPATTLAKGCYGSMFRNCTNLTTAPVLPATTLAESCYIYMFNGCARLSYLKALFLQNLSYWDEYDYEHEGESYYSTMYWLSGVSPTGTLVLHKNASRLIATTTYQESGCPTGWTWMKDVEYVDMGLSVKWATSNIGANAPEELGNYYAWGEYNTKSNYSWSTYRFGDGNSLSKYNTSSSYGSVDKKKVLEEQDDVASVEYGGNWRMPTDTEWGELRTNCTWQWTTRNGVYGQLATSKINGNSIFLPAAGRKSGSQIDSGSNGYYWSSSLTSDLPYCANCFFIHSDVSEVGMSFDFRCIGLPVRPVVY